MKQVFQRSYLSKELCVEEVPAPSLQGAGVLVRNVASLISPGTERATVSFARKGLIAKVQSQPERVELLFRKMRQHGVIDTLQAARRKLENPIPLGYSSSGTVVDVSADCPGVQVGDRVACAGALYANHAEVVYIPKNLCVPLPDTLSFEEGSFVAPGAIALHGVRLANIGLGETVLIIGLGLIGQLAAQLVQAQGGIAIGVDPEPSRLAMARQLGIAHAFARQQSDLQALVESLTNGHGVDSVLITAATPSNDPIFLAGDLCRERGRVVVVGDVGMQIPRSVYYRKELSVIVSRSYGPGRYDERFEREGHAYPAGYVRWTERDNMAMFLHLAATGKVLLKPLIEKRFPLEEATVAYDQLADPTLRPQPLGMILSYPDAPLSPASDTSRQILWFQSSASIAPIPGKLGLSVVGTGQFMGSTILPILQTQAQVRLRGIVSHSGLSARNAGMQGAFAFCSTALADVLDDESTHAVFIATRHDSHTDLVCQALAHGKHVFVEKPLATTRNDLKRCMQACQNYPHQRLWVGFNRRFAPLSQTLKTIREHDAAGQSIHIRYRVLAGRLPEEHWTHRDGGRIIGEVCHFVDWCQFIIGAAPIRVSAIQTGREPNVDVAIQLQFADGSVAQIDYHMQVDSQTASTLGKEKIEVYTAHFVAELDDFKSLRIAQGGKIKKHLLNKVEKGHQQEIELFVKQLKSLSSGAMASKKTSAPHADIPLHELFLTTETTFAILDALKTQSIIPISLSSFELSSSPTPESTE